VPTALSALSVPFAPQFLSEVSEVLGFRLVPGEDFVGVCLGNDFLLHKGSNPGFNGVFIGRRHCAVTAALASAETFQFVHYFWTGVLPGVNLVGLRLCDDFLFNKSGEFFFLSGVAVLVSGGLHSGIESFSVDAENLGDSVFDGISGIGISRTFLCKCGTSDCQGADKSCAHTEHYLAFHFLILVPVDRRR
jgi:hypothetical protein